MTREETAALWSALACHAQAAAQRHARQEGAFAIGATAIAKALGIGRASVYRVLD